MNALMNRFGRLSGSPPGSRTDYFTTRQHRSMYIVSLTLIFGIAFRRITSLDNPSDTWLVLALISAFTILYFTGPSLMGRYYHYQTPYFALQLILVQILGLFKEYLDTWAALYIILGLHAAACCSRRVALAWFGLFIASTLGTFYVEFGLLSGLGRAMAYIIIGVIIISFDAQYAQREDAQTESQVLLEELQMAHQKLVEQAYQAERLAAAQERNRLAQEIHDSVGQKIFAIQLMVEATCLLLEKEPDRASSQLDLLQEQTQEALNQMRQLIAQWKPATQSKVGGAAKGLPLSADL